MKVIINCSWATPSRRDVDGDTIVVKDFESDADYIVDFSDGLFSEMASRFPPEKRAIATCEPSPFSRYDRPLINRIGEFYKGGILSWHPQLLDFPQTKKFRFGTSWVQWETDINKKKFGIGGIFSPKTDPSMPGYPLRQKIIGLQWDIHIPSMVFNATKSWHGHAFDYPRINKQESLEWMYHFAIENCSEPGYFTEKIMDCFMTCSIPLYFGDPIIHEAFDRDGIIVLDRENIAAQVNALTPELYNSKKDAVLRNHETAKQYLDIFRNIKNILKGGTYTPAGKEVTNDWKINGRNGN